MSAGGPSGCVAANAASSGPISCGLTHLQVFLASIEHTHPNETKKNNLKSVGGGGVMVSFGYWSLVIGYLMSKRNDALGVVYL